MEKLITASFITILIITVIPNLIFCYKYYISKEYDDIVDAGVGHFWALYLFFVFGAIKLCLEIYKCL